MAESFEERLRIKTNFGSLVLNTGHAALFPSFPLYGLELTSLRASVASLMLVGLRESAKGPLVLHVGNEGLKYHIVACAHSRLTFAL